jgi:hypothetical protein
MEGDCRIEERRQTERCRREIAAIEAELLAGNSDVQGLCLALSDWSAELRILERQSTRPRHSEALSENRETRTDLGSI